MATGSEALAALKRRIEGLSADSDVWIDINEKLDLVKLTPDQLISEGIPPEKAKQISSSLLRSDFSELGAILGVRLYPKFRIVAERSEKCAKIFCESDKDCHMVRQYLVENLPTVEPTVPSQTRESAYWHFDVPFGTEATPFRLLDLLWSFPAGIVILGTFPLSVEEQPHYLVQPDNLAAWIEEQGDEAWWTVDGDPLLMAQLEFPSPADELSSAIRSVGKPLLIADPSGTGAGEELTPVELNRALDADEWGHRRFQLCWQGSRNQWLLVEEEPTSEHTALN